MSTRAHAKGCTQVWSGKPARRRRRVFKEAGAYGGGNGVGADSGERGAEERGGVVAVRHRRRRAHEDRLDEVQGRVSRCPNIHSGAFLALRTAAWPSGEKEERTERTEGEERRVCSLKACAHPYRCARRAQT